MTMTGWVEVVFSPIDAWPRRLVIVDADTEQRGECLRTEVGKVTQPSVGEDVERVVEAGVEDEPIGAGKTMAAVQGGAHHPGAERVAAKARLGKGIGGEPLAGRE